MKVIIQPNFLWVKTKVRCVHFKRSKTSFVIYALANEKGNIIEVQSYVISFNTGNNIINN